MFISNKITKGQKEESAEKYAKALAEAKQAYRQEASEDAETARMWRKWGVCPAIVLRVPVPLLGAVIANFYDIPGKAKEYRKVNYEQIKFLRSVMAGEDYPGWMIVKTRTAVLMLWKLAEISPAEVRRVVAASCGLIRADDLGRG